MYVYEYEGLGSIKSFGKAFKNLGEKALKPLTTKISLNPIKQVKNLTHSGLAIGKAAENVVVRLNPLNTTLKQFDEKGLAAKKRGGIGGWVAGLLGGVGEQARKKPIATTATFALAAKAYAAYGAAGGGGAAAGAGGGGTSFLSTAGSWIAANPETSLSLLSAGAKLASSRGSKPEDINPDTGMPYYAMTDEQVAAAQPKPFMAGMVTGQNVMLFVGISALTVAGYMLFNQPQKQR
jgi:hypothetical protein